MTTKKCLLIVFGALLSLIACAVVILNDGVIEQVSTERTHSTDDKLSPAIPAEKGYEPTPNEQLVQGDVLRQRKEIFELAKTDIPAAYSLVDLKFGGKEATRLKEDILYTIGSIKLDILADALSLLPGDHRKSVASGVINTWAQKDPLRLAAYAKMSLKEELLNSALSQSIGSLVKNGQMDDAARIHKDMPKSQERLDSFKVISASMFSGNRAEILQWLTTLDDPELRKIAEQTIAVKAAKTDSIDEAVKLANQLSSPIAQSILTRGIAAKIAGDPYVDPQTWFTQLPEALQFGARQAYVLELAQRNMERATAVMVSVPDMKQREQILDSLQPIVMKSGLEFTAKWLASMPVDMQPRAASVLATKWASIDQGKARHWIDSLPMGKVRERAEAAYSDKVK